MNGIKRRRWKTTPTTAGEVRRAPVNKHSSDTHTHTHTHGIDRLTPLQPDHVTASVLYSVHSHDYHLSTSVMLCFGHDTDRVMTSFRQYPAAGSNDKHCSSIEATRGVAIEICFGDINFYCTILQYWRHRLQLVRKIVFRDWFWGLICRYTPVAKARPGSSVVYFVRAKDVLYAYICQEYCTLAQGPALGGGQPPSLLGSFRRGWPDGPEKEDGTKNSLPFVVVVISFSLFFFFFTLLLMLYLCVLYIFIFFFLYLMVNKVAYYLSQ